MASVSSLARLVRRSPGFFALAAGTLGLALALATTTFALLDALRHPFVPFPEPERAFTVYLHTSRPVPQHIVEQNFAALRAARTMSIAAVGYLPYAIVDAGGTARTMSAARVTPNLFHVLGVRPQLGRDLSADGGAAGAGIVVSDELWRAALHGTRTLRESTIAVNGTVYPVIGVAPPGVRFPYDIDVWIPAPMSAPGTVELRMCRSLDACAMA